MIVLSLFLVPLVGGLVAFFLREGNAARGWALLVSFIVLALAIAGNMMDPAGAARSFSAPWMGSLGSSFSIRLDGLAGILCLLTAAAYPVILIATWKSTYARSHNFFALML